MASDPYRLACDGLSAFPKRSSLAGVGLVLPRWLVKPLSRALAEAGTALPRPSFECFIELFLLGKSYSNCTTIVFRFQSGATKSPETKSNMSSMILEAGRATEMNHVYLIVLAGALVSWLVALFARRTPKAGNAAQHSQHIAQLTW